MMVMGQSSEGYSLSLLMVRSSLRTGDQIMSPWILSNLLPEIHPGHALGVVGDEDTLLNVSILQYPIPCQDRPRSQTL